MPLVEGREVFVVGAGNPSAAFGRVVGRVTASCSLLLGAVGWALCGLEDAPLAVERFDDGLFVSKGSSRRGGRRVLMLMGICETGAVAGRGVVGNVVLGSHDGCGG